MDKIRYTAEVDKQLLELHKSNKSIKEIAATVGHSELSIGYRLRKLKKLQKEHNEIELEEDDAVIDNILGVEEEVEVEEDKKDKKIRLRKDKADDKELIKYASDRSKIYPPRDECKNFDGVTCQIINQQVLKCIICDTFKAK